MILMPNEVVVKEASVDTFTATLTNFRLCIDGLASEESYPIDGITGLAIVDDLKSYNEDLKKAESKKKKYFIWGGIIGFLGLSSFSGGVIQFGVFCLFIAVVLVTLAYMGEKPILNSTLTIMQMGATRTFDFAKQDANAPNLKKLIDEINTEFVMRKQGQQNINSNGFSKALSSDNSYALESAAPSSQTGDKISLLKELKQMLDDGIINQQEFNDQKAKILA